MAAIVGDARGDRQRINDTVRRLTSVVEMAARLVLQDADGKRDADTHQDQAADEFAALAGPGADPTAEFQADQGHCDADGADDDCGERDADMERTQSESDGEVVDAKSCPRYEQPPRALPSHSSRGLAVWAPNLS